MPLNSNHEEATNLQFNNANFHYVIGIIIYYVDNYYDNNYNDANCRNDN